MRNRENQVNVNVKVNELSNMWQFIDLDLTFRRLYTERCDRVLTNYFKQNVIVMTIYSNL